jgi:hypothetical protein
MFVIPIHLSQEFLGIFLEICQQMYSSGKA